MKEMFKRKKWSELLKKASRTNWMFYAIAGIICGSAAGGLMVTPLRFNLGIPLLVIGLILACIATFLQIKQRKIRQKNSKEYTAKTFPNN